MLHQHKNIIAVKSNLYQLFSELLVLSCTGATSLCSLQSTTKWCCELKSVYIYLCNKIIRDYFRLWVFCAPISFLQQQLCKDFRYCWRNAMLSLVVPLRLSSLLQSLDATNRWRYKTALTFLVKAPLLLSKLPIVWCSQTSYTSAHI